MVNNNDFFGGKLKKILASMCSLFVGASGVSRAEKPGTSIPTKLRFDKDANVFGFGDFGWKLESDAAKRENSWLVRNYFVRYQPFVEFKENRFDIGFKCEDGLFSFCIWSDHEIVFRVFIPKGILFDVMRHFETNYFRNDDNARNRGTKLSCAAGTVDANADDEVFLRFILWAFCGSDRAIGPDSASVDELREDIFECVLNLYSPSSAGDKFKVMDVGDKERGNKIRAAVLRTGYFLENFNNRVSKVYNGLGYDLTDINSMGKLIIQLNKEKETLKNQKRTDRALSVLLIGLIGGGVLVEGTHRFLGEKRSRSSEVNKGKPSSNKKGGQKAKQNLKKQKS